MGVEPAEAPEDGLRYGHLRDALFLPILPLQIEDRGELPQAPALGAQHQVGGALRERDDPERRDSPVDVFDSAATTAAYATTGATSIETIGSSTRAQTSDNIRSLLTVRIRRAVCAIERKLLGYKGKRRKNNSSRRPILRTAFTSDCFRQAVEKAFNTTLRTHVLL